MNVFVGSVELRTLLLAGVLGIFHLAIGALLSLRDQGPYYFFGIRECEAPPLNKFTSRTLRSFENFKETFVFFAVAALAVVIAGRHNNVSAFGTQLYFWCRISYAVIFIAGIPLLRTAVWGGSILGLLMVLSALIS